MQEKEPSSRLKSRQAIAAMMDRNWSLIRLDNETVQPQWLLYDDARFLGWCTYVVPLSWMPTLVRQWAGPDGERVFKELTLKKNAHRKS